MMRLMLVVLVGWACWPAGLYGAFSYPSISPAQAGCAGTLAAGGFTAGMMVHTPAAVCLLEGVHVELAGQRLYSLQELDSYLAAAAICRGRWGFGAAFDSMGEPEFYLETSLTGYVGCAVVRQLRIGASVGYNLVQMTVPYGSLNAGSFGCGMMLIPSPRLRVYASVKNPLKPKLLSGTEMRRELNAGIAVGGFRAARIALEVQARSGCDVCFRVGEVYEVSRVLALSGGIMTPPFLPSFGCSFTWTHFRLLYAYRYHPELGGTHIWGISISM